MIPFFIFWCLALALNVTLLILIIIRILYAASAAKTLRRFRQLNTNEARNIRIAYASVIHVLSKEAAIHTIVIVVSLVAAHFTMDALFVLSSFISQTEVCIPVSSSTLFFLSFSSASSFATQCITSDLNVFRKYGLKGTETPSISSNWTGNFVHHAKASRARSQTPPPLMKGLDTGIHLGPIDICRA